MKSFLLSLEYLILTHIWENCLLQFLFLSSVKSHEFPTAVCLMRNRFQEHYSHWGEIKSIWIHKQERIFHFAVIRCIIFSRYRTNFPISQLLASSMLPTSSYTAAIMNPFYQYETFCHVFIGDTSFSFRYTCSGMISVWYNLYLDLTLSQTSSDD